MESPLGGSEPPASVARRLPTTFVGALRGPIAARTREPGPNLTRPVPGPGPARRGLVRRRESGTWDPPIRLSQRGGDLVVGPAGRQIRDFGGLSPFWCSLDGAAAHTASLLLR